MKTVLTSGYTFTASAKTLDFSGTTGFDVRRLLAVLNLTRGVLVYAVGTAGLGYSALTGSVLTLAFDTTGHANGDALMVLYDAPNTAAQDASLQTMVTKLQALVDAAQSTDPTSISGTVTANLGTLNGAATETTLQAIKAALLAQVDFESSLVTDGASFYVRRETANEVTGVITVTFTDMAGNAASPVVANLVPAASGNTRVVETALFDVTTAGTGTTVGDVIARVIIYDTRTNTIAASYWHNLTTGAALASAPSAGSIIEQVRNLAAGAATSAKQDAIVSAIGAIAAPDGPGTPAAADRVVAARASTGTLANVAASVSDGVILAANANRLGFYVENDSTATLYLLLAAGTASATSRTVAVGPGLTFDDDRYAGVVKGVWSAANGAARVTEFA